MMGIVKSSLPGGREMQAVQALHEAKKLGLQGLLFNSPWELSPRLDAGELREVRAEADRLRLHLSASLGVVNPALPFRGEQIARAGGGDLEAGVRRLVICAAEIGIHDLFFVIGMIEERFHPDVAWQAQRDALAALVLRCAPLLRDTQSRLLLKTHEEITTQEVVSLVETVGPELIGVALDPVNVLCRMEDPLEAARRVAPYVAQVHVDDAVVRFQDDGIRRFLAPLGEGVLSWDALFALIPNAPRWIELHSGQFMMPVFDRDWIRAQPDIVLTEFAAVLAMAQRFGSREILWDQSRPAERLPDALRKLLK
jgi:sugar phosphate isomerase/epimerase